MAIVAACIEIIRIMPIMTSLVCNIEKYVDAIRYFIPNMDRRDIVGGNVI